MTRKRKMTAVILATAFVAYNVILFLLCGFTGHTGVYWTSWSFMLVSFAAMVGAGVWLGEKGMFLRDWLFGYSIVKYSTVYSIAEFSVSTLFIIFERRIKWQWGFAAQFILLCLYGLCAVSCFRAKEAIDEIHVKTDNKTVFWRSLQADVDILAKKCPDSILQVKLRQLSEAIRCSDPMSGDELLALEKEIVSMLSECGKAISGGNFEQAEGFCQAAQLLVEERNKQCKALKHGNQWK